MPSTADPTTSPAHVSAAGGLDAGAWRAALWGAAALSAAASILHGIGLGAGIPSHEISVAGVVDVLAASVQMLLAVVLAIAARDGAGEAARGTRGVLLGGAAVTLAIGLWFAAPLVWPAADGLPHAGAHGTPTSAGLAATDLAAVAIETLLVATLVWLSFRATGSQRASSAARARDPDDNDPAGDDRREDDHRPGR